MRFSTHLPVVLQLLQGEDVLIEILLEFLISIVDIKLFKPVHLQDTRTKCDILAL